MVSGEYHEVHDRLAPHHNQATISTGHRSFSKVFLGYKLTCLLQPVPPLDWKEHGMRGHFTCHGSIKPIAQNSASQTCYRLHNLQNLYN